MKLLNILTLGATSAALVLAAGCADDFDTNGFKVDQPQETAQYEYLQAYGPLKSYVNRSGVGPMFRLGGALDASEMNKRGLVYALAVANYDEVTFGNHMKHNFVMNADGAMDFGTIRSAIETARNGGLKIFGHTLCWHEQQQGKYLLSLLKDKEIEVDPDQKKEVLDYEINWGSQDDYSMWGQWGKGATTAINTADDCLEVVNPEAAANFWDLQFFIADGFNIAKGTEYELTVTARTLGGEANVRGAIGTWSETKNLAFTVNEEWNDYKVKFTSEFEGGSHVLVQFGDFVGTVQFKSVKLTHSEAAAITIPVNVLEDDFSSGEVPAGWGNGSTREIQDGVLVMTNPSKVNSWEAQTAYDVSTPFEVDTRYFLTMKIKGSKAGSISAGFQNPDGYKGCGDFPAINVTTDWTEVKVATTCNGDGASRFLFSYGAYDGTLYIDDLCIYYEKSANSIPLTPEEKADILKGELKRWIYGMMEACGGYVTAWDVVNEAIADGGQYGVKYGDDTDNKFYWQNYLGENYVRYAVQYAREAFAEYGGNPDELLLFANDYNLEAAYNNTAKTDGLIRTIRQWEADGITRIDGIGTQMHVSYSLNPEWQAKQEECVVKMFEKLAASGKLIHISELDMGIQDADGNTIMTPDLTFEQAQQMSDYYKFIITKYFEIIPKEQQYGIVQWAATDSPEGSGWRAGEPIGIWDINHARKPAYAGWCDALKEATNK
ncbi:MAG: endo-1,4-beta-xylanase [Muribaculaceae bacterium]|nr:endo-1,4-beta-xylanase [Muribaculaceae bacterium]